MGEKKGKQSNKKNDKQSYNKKRKHSCKKKCKHSCKKDYLYQYLKEFRSQEVTIKTKSGDIISGELQSVKKCSIKIIEPGMITPYVDSRLTVIRSKDVESFSVDLLDD